MEDRDWIQDLMRRSGFRGSEYTFSNLYNWSSVYTVAVGRMNDFLIIRSGQSAWHYLFPAGSGDVHRALDAMLVESHEQGQKLEMYGITPEHRALIEMIYPERFDYHEVRNNFDYIYLRESLATLAGKKLHGKRNHISRFQENNPDWRYETLTRENLAEAWDMNLEWCHVNGCHETHSLQREACAVRSAFEHYFELELTGGLLRAGGRVVAFTFGSPSTEDTFVVHVEKAFADIQGAYPMINQQFVKNELSTYTYINREDDVGDEGLRRAKESYYPAFMYERYTAVEKEQA
ncbi:MAG: phosphatidylglycerol lysyltransferase domain-containing protein [Oscillospiraceae bacterium]